MKRTALIVGALCVALVGAPLVTVGLVVAGTFFVANSTKHLAAQGGTAEHRDALREVRIVVP